MGTPSYHHRRALHLAHRHCKRLGSTATVPLLSTEVTYSPEMLALRTTVRAAARSRATRPTSTAPLSLQQQLSSSACRTRSYNTGTLGAFNLRVRHITSSDASHFSPFAFTAVTSIATVTAILAKKLVSKKVKSKAKRQVAATSG